MVNRAEARCKVQQSYSQYHLWKHGHFYCCYSMPSNDEEAALKFCACAIVPALKGSCKCRMDELMKTLEGAHEEEKPDEEPADVASY